VNLVVDASVAIKWIVDESGSEDANQILDGRFRLYAPDFLSVEVGNAVVRAIRRGFLTPLTGAEAMTQLSSPRIELRPVSGLIESAYALAVQHGGSVSDAAYITLARNLSAEVVTADLLMMAVARKAKVKARLIA